LFEPRGRVPEIRGYVERRAPLALRIDVRERAVRKARAGGGAKRWHGSRLLGEENDRALVLLCGEAPVPLQRDASTLRAAAERVAAAGARGRSRVAGLPRCRLQRE